MKMRGLVGAKLQRILERTLRRRRHELGMSVEGRVFSNLSDNELDDYVRENNTNGDTWCRPEDGPRSIKATQSRSTEGSCSPVTMQG